MHSINDSGRPVTLEVMRHILGSIDLKDVEEEMTESDRKDYCAAISAVFPRLEKDIKRFLHAQLMYASNQAENWEQVIFGRGTFNGMALLLEYWKQINNKHISDTKEKESFDKHKIINEI